MPDSNRRVVFVVHGRNKGAVDAMMQFLSSLGLHGHDFEDFRAQQSGTPFIWEVIEKALDQAAAIVILATPDEYVALHPGLAGPHDVPRWQARPNVYIEAGASMMRDRKRTLLVRLGRADIASDFAGMHFMQLGNDNASRTNFMRSLKAVCDIDDDFKFLDSERSGDFEACLEPPKLRAVQVRSPFDEDDQNQLLPIDHVSQLISSEVRQNLETLRQMNHQQRIAYQTEFKATNVKYDAAKFIMRRMGEALSAHYGQLIDRIPNAKFELIEKALEVTNDLKGANISYGPNGNYKLILPWGLWVFETIDRFTADPMNAELPNSPNQIVSDDD